MKKGEKSDSFDRLDKGKSIMEEKEKRSSRRTRIGIDFDSKTFKIRDQEAVDKYLAGYGFCWSPGIKTEFYPIDVDISLAPHGKEGMYMYPLGLVLGLRLPMTKFVPSVLIFYEVASLRWWHGILYWGLKPSTICTLSRLIIVKSSTPYTC